LYYTYRNPIPSNNIAFKVKIQWIFKYPLSCRPQNHAVKNECVVNRCRGDIAAHRIQSQSAVSSPESASRRIQCFFIYDWQCFRSRSNCANTPVPLAPVLSYHRRSIFGYSRRVNTSAQEKLYFFKSLCRESRSQQGLIFLHHSRLILFWSSLFVFSGNVRNGCFAERSRPFPTLTIPRFPYIHRSAVYPKA